MVLLGISLPSFPQLRFNLLSCLPLLLLSNHFFLLRPFPFAPFVCIQLQNHFIPNQCSSLLSSSKKKKPSPKLNYFKHISWKRICSTNFLQHSPTVHQDFLI
jgi:hypothetical protein